MRKNSLYLLIGLLAISFAFTSCLDNDDNSFELTSDAAITEFSIGDIAMKDTIKTKDGSKDSTIYYTLPTSRYKFTIDQAQGLIYNADSLPIGTDVTKVTVDTLRLTGYYVTYLKNGQDTIWTNTDSIDFTKPVTFKAYALNGAVRQYQVKLNVHRFDPDSLQWSNLQAPGLQIPADAKHKAVYCQEEMYIFAQMDGGVLQVTSSADGQNWDGWQPASLPGKADYTSVLALNDRFYILSDGKLYTSTDGIDWSLANDSRPFKQLFAASPTNGELYAVSGTDILSITHAGGVVNTIGQASEKDFPVQNLSYSASVTRANGDIERLVLVGTRGSELENDTTAVVWAKLSNEAGWTYYPQASNNTLGCPKLKNLATIAYDGKLYAFGGDYDIPGWQTRPADFKPFKYMYESVDGGISWRPRTDKVTLPGEFLDRSADFSYLVGKDNFIWIFWSPSDQTEGKTEVWKGRINRLAPKYIK